MNIFVDNLNHQTSEKQLHDLFMEFGEVLSVHIIVDHLTRRSKGYAFIEMQESMAGKKAIARLHNIRVHMQSITVTETQPDHLRLAHS